jgi:hypothetical protein
MTEEQRLRKRAATRAWFARNTDYRANWTTANFERKAALNKRWVADNRERYDALTKAWRNKNGERHAEGTRVCRIKRHERIAGRPRPECCEVCNRDGVICFDHCHTYGAFRGWLCVNCNFALGLLCDTPMNIDKLIKYIIKRHRGITPTTKTRFCESCGKTDKLHFDHCHITGTFRGWLCHHCNTALGHASDSPVILRKLRAYLNAASAA